MHDPHAPRSDGCAQPAGPMPSRLDAPRPARDALARSLDRLCAGAALAMGRLVRVDRLTDDDRTWRQAAAHSHTTHQHAPGTPARAFLDAAEASVRLRALLLNKPDRTV